MEANMKAKEVRVGDTFTYPDGWSFEVTAISTKRGDLEVADLYGVTSGTECLLAALMPDDPVRITRPGLSS